MDGIRAGRCFDGDSGTNQPGGEVQVFPCMHRWVQFLSVGSSSNATKSTTTTTTTTTTPPPPGSLYFTIPSHIVKQIHQLGHEQHPHMCLGVWGRGVADEVEWNDPASKLPPDPEPEEGWPPLSKYVNEELFSTQCTNTGAVVEWLFVPYIVEDEYDDDGEEEAAAAAAESVDDDDDDDNNDDKPLASEL